MKLKRSMSLLACTFVGSAVYSQHASADDAAELAKKLSNPISSLISMPIKLDWDSDIGAADVNRSTYFIQPVIPIGLNDKWNIISRTIVPFHIDAESSVAGVSDTTGMGDILQSFFFSPKAPTAGGLIWGVGPLLSVPTGSDGLTSDKFSMGPTAILLKQDGPWTIGFLGSQLWSVSGDDDVSDVSSTFLQPFASYTTKTHTTFGLNTESSYNGKADDGEEWTVPINLTVAQLMEFGKQPVQFQLGYRNYVSSPDDAQGDEVMDWGLRFQVTFLFPK